MKGSRTETLVRCQVRGPQAREAPGRAPEPCTFVIFGASGDLTRHKLVPALYALYLHGSLPDPFAVLGCARTEMGREEFARRLRTALGAAHDLDLSRWGDFAGHLHYQPLDYGDPTSYGALAESLRQVARQTGGNRLFYLATPPTLYGTIARMLGAAGLATEGKRGGWARIVVEKPYGSDYRSAVELTRTIQESFREDQIYRIDHFLTKETVQNVLMLRFANAVFEPLWNRRYIDRVEITATETLGVEHRAGYYEKAGVIRDMFQNHLMQLLALCAMEPPSVFEADRVRDEKVKVFRSLQPFSAEDPFRTLVLGQYGPGTIDGQTVPAYRQEPGVAADSLTPTYARLKLFIDNWRWQGVPFYLTSGKRLAGKLTEMAIQFKQVPHSMFRHVLGEHISANRLILGVQPQEMVGLTFQTKHPGAEVCLRSVSMHFDYYRDYAGPLLDAYEKALMDCMQGDHMLFWRQDGVELSWAFLTPIIEECETCPDRAERLHLYPAGSWGPEAGRLTA